MKMLHKNYVTPLRKGNIGILSIPEREDREKKAESFFKETIAKSSQTWQRNQVYKSMKLIEHLIILVQKDILQDTLY